MAICKFTVDEDGIIHINGKDVPFIVTDYTIRPKKGGNGKLKEVTLVFPADVEMKFMKDGTVRR